MKRIPAQVCLFIGYIFGLAMGFGIPVVLKHDRPPIAESREVAIISAERVPLDAPRSGVELVPLGPTEGMGNGWARRQFVFPDEPTDLSPAIDTQPGRTLTSEPRK